jgi:hypothetical protein
MVKRIAMEVSADPPDLVDPNVVFIINILIEIFEYYVPVVLIVHGLFGNVVSVGIMLKPEHRKVTTSMYMLALGILDMSVSAMIFLYFVRRWYKSAWFLRTDAFCKAYVYCSSFFYAAAAYVIVFMTFDRFVATFWPLKVNFIMTTRRTRLFIIGSTVAAAGTCVPFAQIALFDHQSQACAESPSLLQEIVDFLYMICSTFMPFGIILVFNCLIAMKLTSAARERRLLAVAGKSRKDAGEIRVTLVLQAVSWLFLLGGLPWYVVTNYWYYLSLERELSVLENLVEYLTKIVVTTVWMSSHCINFYIYILGFKKFQQDVMGIFHCKAKGK